MLDEQIAFLRTVAPFGGWGAAARNRRHQFAVKVDTEDSSRSRSWRLIRSGSFSAASLSALKFRRKSAGADGAIAHTSVTMMGLRSPSQALRHASRHQLVSE